MGPVAGVNGGSSSSSTWYVIGKEERGKRESQDGSTTWFGPVQGTDEQAMRGSSIFNAQGGTRRPFCSTNDRALGEETQTSR